VRQRSFRAIGLLTVTLLSIAGITWVGVENSSAKAAQRSVCVDKDTREMKIRKNCRNNENFLMEADVLIQGGKSAYETWLDLGNKGTQAQFIASLAGSSGGGSSYNPFANTSCLDAVQVAESRIGRSILSKDVWDLVQRNSGCQLSSVQANWLNEGIGNERDLRDTLASFDLTVLSTPSITVTRFANQPAHYTVPIRMDFSLNLRGGWIVCETGKAPHGIAGFATTSQVERWTEFQSYKTAPNTYSVTTSALFDPMFGLALGLDSRDDFQNQAGKNLIPLCKPDTSTTTGWRLLQDYSYVPLSNPGDFTGLGIHYVSDWGWE
jgi:hypothetical protein